MKTKFSVCKFIYRLHFRHYKQHQVTQITKTTAILQPIVDLNRVLIPNVKEVISFIFILLRLLINAHIFGWLNRNCN